MSMHINLDNRFKKTPIVTPVKSVADPGGIFEVTA
jgi:hypothetical protein